MSDVDLLREAANKMRERAQAVEDPAFWTAEVTERGNAWVNLPGCKHAWGMHGFPDEARHVAAIASPAVALAVADWLECEAERYEWAGPSVYGHATAVARAYLRSGS